MRKCTKSVLRWEVEKGYTENDENISVCKLLTLARSVTAKSVFFISSKAKEDVLVCGWKPCSNPSAPTDPNGGGHKKKVRPENCWPELINIHYLLPPRRKRILHFVVTRSVCVHKVLIEGAFSPFSTGGEYVTYFSLRIRWKERIFNKVKLGTLGVVILPEGH